jgi:hypothetical protein
MLAVEIGEETAFFAVVMKATGGARLMGEAPDRAGELEPGDAKILVERGIEQLAMVVAR